MKFITEILFERGIESLKRPPNLPIEVILKPEEALTITTVHSNLTVNPELGDDGRFVALAESIIDVSTIPQPTSLFALLPVIFSGVSFFCVLLRNFPSVLDRLYN